jgi:hypothetical protein
LAALQAPWLLRKIATERSTAPTPRDVAAGHL